MPLYHESYWISCNIYDAFQRSYSRMLRSRFYSYHMPFMLLFLPLQRCENSEGGPPCNSMPLVWLGLTICVVKCSCFLVRHHIFKSNAPLLFRWLPSKLKGALGAVRSPETPLLCTLFYLKGPAPCCHWLSIA